MNCKPGDLAFISCRNEDLNGRVVEVLKLAPKGVFFLLPDGTQQSPQQHDWVCFFPSPIVAPMADGSFRHTKYATVPDSRLRPISGVSVEDEAVAKVSMRC